MSYSLEIKQLFLQINIGVEQEERDVPQEIEFYFKISFAKMPESCLSDNIEDTICYDKLIFSIKQFLNGKTYKLIENLGFEIHNFLKTQIPGQIILVRVSKKPKIIGFTGECSFTIEG